MQKSTRLQHISCVPRQDADEGTYGRIGTEHNLPVHVLPGKAAGKKGKIKSEYGKSTACTKSQAILFRPLRRS